MKHLFSGIALGAALTLPGAAMACGGLFCDNTQPVNQAAERILFAHDGETLHMHVRITYQGPPTEFAWLLPTSPEVEVGVSSEQLFTRLDQQFAPRFTLRTEIDPRCQDDFARGGAAGADASVQNAPPSPVEDEAGGVQVLSREPVGAFDTAILRAETIDDLRAWLDENGYQIPEATDATLAPYVEMGAAFVAVKLLPDRDAGDVSPLRLSFPGDRPAIPIVPTSVAADPDMGIIVHVIGQSRAIPVNYRHVIINEAAIDWQGGGQNYADVVSQAADEANGKAFATDFAGRGGVMLRVMGQRQLDAVRAAETSRDIVEALNLWDLFWNPDADLQRLVSTGILLPDDISLQDFLNCPDCYDDRGIEIDGAALADALEREYDAPREQLNALFEQNPYLTRLYSTLSPAEMTLDPEFAFNPDLGEVPNNRVAVQRVGCDFEGNLRFGRAVIETPSGIRFRLQDGVNPNVIRRQAGETVRGMGVPGAQVIQRTLTAGPAEVQSDRTPDIEEMNPIALNDGGCACDAAEGSAPTAFGLLALLGLVGLRRRRS